MHAPIRSMLKALNQGKLHELMDGERHDMQGLLPKPTVQKAFPVEMVMVLKQAIDIVERLG